MLILHQLEPYPWAVVGLAIGAITLLLLWVTNQRLGISTGFENLCGLVLKAPYLHCRLLRELPPPLLFLREFRHRELLLGALVQHDEALRRFVLVAMLVVSIIRA